MTADIQHLLQSGIESLGLKLQAVAAVIPPTDEGDVIYLTRLADAWSYFYSTTLVFLQAVFLPATLAPPLSDPLSSLSALNPSHPLSKGLIGLSVLHGIPLSEPRHERLSLDVRLTALVTFKDSLLWPIRLRLQGMLFLLLPDRALSVQH